MNTQTAPDVVVAGAGIAGAAIAAVLARAGHSVTMLEATREHVDRVRGEFIVPWGVAEAQALGLHDVLVAAGGRHMRLNLPYGEGVDPAAARARALDMSALVPGVPGSMCLAHPRACDALGAAALAHGATLVRGVRELRVTPGHPPRVRFDTDDGPRELSPRIVIGADGRASRVRRDIGARQHPGVAHHFIAGLLVDGVPAWPDQEQSIGVEGEVGYYVFPQGAGRLRLYLCVARGQPHRFAGPDRARAFLSAFRLRHLPFSAELCAAVPAGPCRVYPNEGMSLDRVAADGVVLVGDAAGYDDPTLGQGIANALHDVRLVTEAMHEAPRWRCADFAGYAAQRAERSRRQAVLSGLVARLRMEFDDSARARRRRAAALITASPELQRLMLSSQTGPHQQPAALFDEPLRASLVA